jgi:hypothetical protein
VTCGFVGLAWPPKCTFLIRDEEVVGSNPATPTEVSPAQGRSSITEAGPEFVLVDLLGEIWETILSDDLIILAGSRLFTSSKLAPTHHNTDRP